MSGPLDVLRRWVPEDHLPDCGLGRNRHFCDCDCEERRAALAAVEQRLAYGDALAEVVQHVLRNGEQGKQSRRRLKDALARFQAGSPAETCDACGKPMTGYDRDGQWCDDHGSPADTKEDA